MPLYQTQRRCYMSTFQIISAYLYSSLSTYAVSTKKKKKVSRDFSVLAFAFVTSGCSSILAFILNKKDKSRREEDGSKISLVIIFWFLVSFSSYRQPRTEKSKRRRERSSAPPPRPGAGGNNSPGQSDRSPGFLQNPAM